MLNIAMVNLQLKNFEEGKRILESLAVKDLGQRAYLYYGCYAEYYAKRNDLVLAVSYLDKAISITSNSLERAFLTKKKKRFETQLESN